MLVKLARDLPKITMTHCGNTLIQVPQYKRWWACACGRIYSQYTEDWLRPRLNKNGYLELKTKSSGKHKSYRVHRLVADAFLSLDNARPHINHKNGVKTDNRLLNLERCTSAENFKHALNTGLIGRGQDNCSAKLTDQNVLLIRKMHTEGYTMAAIGHRFSISGTHVKRIIDRRAWAHI